MKVAILAGGAGTTLYEETISRPKPMVEIGDLPAWYDHKYVYSHLGYNMKVTDVQAAVGVAQMGKLPDIIAKRKANFNHLKQALMDLETFFVLPEVADRSDPSWFGFPLLVWENTPFTRNECVTWKARKLLPGQSLEAI